MLFSTAGTAGKARLTIAPDGPPGEGSGLQEHIRGETGGRRGPAGRHRAASGGPRRGSGRGRRQGEPEWQAVSPTACRSGPPGPGLPIKKERLVLQQTSNYQLSQWDAEDRILREDFNGDNSKLDEALKSQAEALAAETAARKAADCYVKLMDLTLTENTQKWDIDMSGIDLTQYQKLVIYPRLSSNSYQPVYLHINGKTSGYYGPGNDTSCCGSICTMNDDNPVIFGMCEFTMLLNRTNIYVLQAGVGSNSFNVLPQITGYRCPNLEEGVTHLDTLNLWFSGASYRIFTGSTVQIYGLKR